MTLIFIKEKRTKTFFKKTKERKKERGGARDFPYQISTCKVIFQPEGLGQELEKVTTKQKRVPM